METTQRDKIEQLKAERANLKTPLERIAFDNDPANGPVGLRIVAMTESAPQLREP